MPDANLAIAVYVLGTITAVLLLLILCCLSRLLSDWYIRHQISILRHHPFNQPATNSFLAPSNEPCNPTRFAVQGGIYDAECDRLTAILEDRSWMGVKRIWWVVTDLAHRFWGVVGRVTRGVSERVRLLWRLLNRDSKEKRNARIWPGTQGVGEESGI